MLILDMTRGRFIETDTEQQDQHPAENLQPNWNPIQTQPQAVQSTRIEPWRPSPGVLGHNLDWL